MKVLIVDDSSSMRSIQKKILKGIEEFEFSFVEAGNGREALIALHENNYNISFIICDVNMPGMNGIDMLNAVKSIPAARKIPVIMVSSVGQSSQITDAIKAGASTYLTKPFVPENLTGKIRRLIQEKSLA